MIEEKTDEEITSDYFEAGSDFYSIVKFAVEGIKKELSERPSVHHTFRFGDEEVEIVISRRDFENISSGYVRRTIEIMQNCIRESGISENELDEIILTGGSTRMPMIIRAVKDRFPNNEIRPCFDPDESVARGAAIYSDLLDSLEDDEGFESSSQIHCVMSKTYGIISLDKNGEKVVSNILFRNTTLPIVGASKTYRVPCDCDVIQIDVYENEGTVEEKTMNLENSGQVCIGNFNVPIRGLKEGECMTVTLGVDEQKALSCTAIYKGQEFYHQFSPNSAMTEEEIENASSLLMLMDG